MSDEYVVELWCPGPGWVELSRHEGGREASEALVALLAERQHGWAQRGVVRVTAGGRVVLLAEWEGVRP